jgi:hypothetical protein
MSNGIGFIIVGQAGTDLSLKFEWTIGDLADVMMIGG